MQLLICILQAAAYSSRLGPPLLFGKLSGMVRMQGREIWEVRKQLLNIPSFIIES